MKKLFLFVFVLFVLYAVVIFLAPDTSSKIEKMLGFSGTTQKIHDIKQHFDIVVTDIPSVQEFKSGALDIKESFQDGLDTTKGKIDDVRVTLSGAQDTINNTFDTIDGVVETVKSAKDVVNNLNENTEALENFGNSIKGTVNIKDVGAATGND